MALSLIASPLASSATEHLGGPAITDLRLAQPLCFAPWGPHVLTVEPERTECLQRRPATTRPDSSLSGTNAIAVRSTRGSAPRPGGVWIGAEPTPVVIDDREYRLTYAFVGQNAGADDLATIDPSLAVGTHRAALPPLPKVLTGYGQFPPPMRRAYLEWIHGERRDPDVPPAFLQHFIYSLEVAIVREKRRDILGSAQRELELLTKLRPNDVNLRCFANLLIELCQWLDPRHRVDPIDASAPPNYSAAMPFRVRRFIGEMLKQSPVLEADTALLLILQQPNTHFEAQVGRGFPFIHHHWTENYAYRFDGGVEFHPPKTLSLEYECLDGEDLVEFPSDIPDPASAPPPPELVRFFDDCCRAWREVGQLPSAEQKAVMKEVKSLTKLRGRPVEWTLRGDFEQRITARMVGAGPFSAPASELLGDLFEMCVLPPNKQVPLVGRKRMQRALSDLGYGFEPDKRFGLPSRIRPDTELMLFAEEPLPFEQPSDAFLLAQAAVVLSAIGTRFFEGLAPLDVGEIEHRLPYRYRFDDRQLRRLEATFAFMHTAEGPRELLAMWPRQIKRNQRVKDIDQGFGIAFAGQGDNPAVRRFAVAVSKALHADDRRVEGFLREVERQSKPWPDPATVQHSSAAAMIDPGGPSRSPENSDEQMGRRPFLPYNPPRSSIAGLPAALADILIALLARPRSRSELFEITRARQIELSGALEQLNEWAIAVLGAHVTNGHHTVRINPDVYDALDCQVQCP